MLIEGRLQSHSYEDNEGVKRYVTEIIAPPGGVFGPTVRRDQRADRHPGR